MSNHIGETVKMADKYRGGLVNDHVSVLHTSDVEDPRLRIYNFYSRSNYQVGRGPQPMPRDLVWSPLIEFLGEGEKPRGWGHANTIAAGIPSLDDAMELAEVEAKNRGVVLYLDDSTTTIKWHPEGWEPRYG